MNYEDDAEKLRQSLQDDVRFALEREARRYGFVGEGQSMRHPELGLKLTVRVEETT
jgi:hypothetical protein